MPIPGNLLTTAMAVMPHTDADRAMQTALSLDIPFWPQLPLMNYHEDMYVQAAEHFPGILLDVQNRTLRFSMNRFMEELGETMARFDQPDYFDISPAYSAVYHAFLKLDLSDRPAIRGQLEGPVSFGFNILDQDDRPILFDDTVRSFLLEFMAKRINVQLSRLQAKNDNAFMFVDEPGLQFVFSALSGYDDFKAKQDLEAFFAMVERPRGIHLCGNPDWDFLLNLDLDILRNLPSMHRDFPLLIEGDVVCRSVRKVHPHLLHWIILVLMPYLRFLKSRNVPCRNAVRLLT